MLTNRDLDEIEAQIDDTVTYYVPALIAEIRRLRRAAEALGASAPPAQDEKCQRCKGTGALRGIEVGFGGIDDGAECSECEGTGEASSPLRRGDGWRSIDDDGPKGVGGQVWVAYPNPKHPDGWNLRIQWTPIQRELGVEPLYWCGVERPLPPAPASRAVPDDDY